MDEIFENYEITELMQRMLNEIWAAETSRMPEVRDLAITLLQMDMATQYVTANRGQIGWFLDRRMLDRDAEALLNGEME